MRGRLYDLPYGYPALVVPAETVLARGAPGRAEDLDLEAALPEGAGPPPGEAVHGDLLELPDGPSRLSRLDALEGFGEAGHEDLYHRVLVPAWLSRGEVVPAWTYVWPHAPQEGALLPDGRWPVARRGHHEN